MVIAQKLFKAIKDIYPNVKLHVASPAWTIPLVSRMPEVDQSISLPFAHGELNISKRYLIAKALRHEGYAQAIVLTNSFKSALIPFLLAFQSALGFWEKCALV